MSKALFPVCASFGPVFMAIASMFPNREGLSYGVYIAVPGALMVSAALNILYREFAFREKSADQVEG